MSNAKCSKKAELRTSAWTLIPQFSSSVCCPPALFRNVYTYPFCCKNHICCFRLSTSLVSQAKHALLYSTANLDGQRKLDRKIHLFFFVALEREWPSLIDCTFTPYLALMQHRANSASAYRGHKFESTFVLNFETFNDNFCSVGALLPRFWLLFFLAFNSLVVITRSFGWATGQKSTSTRDVLPYSCRHTRRADSAAAKCSVNGSEPAARQRCTCNGMRTPEDTVDIDYVIDTTQILGLCSHCCGKMCLSLHFVLTLRALPIHGSTFKSSFRPVEIQWLHKLKARDVQAGQSPQKGIESKRIAARVILLRYRAPQTRTVYYS